MGTLASELTPHAERIAGHPRVYVDANVPANWAGHSSRWITIFSTTVGFRRPKAAACWC